MSLTIWSSAAEIRDAVAGGEVSCAEVARLSLDRVSARNPPLNALLRVTEARALARAAELDALCARGGALPPLAGVPLVVKDNLCTRGERTTCASRILEDYEPPYDATAVSRLEGAGALLLGKANLDEFGMGSTGENSDFGPTLNPWDPARVPGGSSSGAAAAVASGMVPCALGSDTGGSVRQPAAFCGLYGLRPTYGRVSRYGLVAFASSLDQVGPLARTARDAFLAFAAISGPDPADSTSLPDPPEPLEPPAPRLEGLRVGLLADQLGADVDPEVRALVAGAAERLRAGGAEVREAALPHAGYGVATYYVLAPAECSSNLARFDGVRYGLREPREELLEQYEASRGAGFGDEVKRRVLAGTFVLSAGYRGAFYERARRARAAIAADFARAFAEVDLLLGPTTPGPAFPLGREGGDPLSLYLCDVFTIPPALAGLPALSVPCGFTAAGLPVGAQLVGRRLEERTLFRAAGFLEEALGLAGRHPS